MSKYIVIWKNGPGQQVSTVVDGHNAPVLREVEYLEKQHIGILENKEAVFAHLAVANATKAAITPELARETLGWDI